MIALDIVLRALGVFYVLASIAIIRNLIMDRMMDQMLSALSMKAQPAREAHRRWFWGVSGLAIGMGGAALVVLSLWAVPLFAIGLLTQAVYLLWARTLYPPETPLEEKGRRQTITAALVYGVVTLVVIVAAQMGRLSPWFDPWALAIPAIGLAVMGTAGPRLVWSPRTKTFGFNNRDDRWPDPEPRPEARRVRLEPMWIGMNLRDLDTNEGVDPWERVDDDLATRISDWAQVFRATEDVNDQRVWAEFASPGAEAEHRLEGDAIVSELTAIFGEGNAEGPAYPADIRYIA